MAVFNNTGLAYNESRTQLPIKSHTQRSASKKTLFHWKPFHMHPFINHRCAVFSAPKPLTVGTCPGFNLSTENSLGARGSQNTPPYHDRPRTTVDIRSGVRHSIHAQAQQSVIHSCRPCVAPWEHSLSTALEIAPS